MLERSLDMTIDITTCVLFTALVAATSAVVVFLRAKDAAAREHAAAREREAVLKIVRAEMAAVGRALVRYTINLHLAHDLPVPEHVWTARNAPFYGTNNNAPTDTPNSNTSPEGEDATATNGEDANHGAGANAADNEDNADDGNDGSHTGDTTVEYSMPESTASDRYHRQMMIEEYAEERREYAYGDGADWFDAMMRMRQADY